MADKVSKKDQKNVRAVEKQLVASTAKAYKNRTCTDVTLSNGPENTQNKKLNSIRVNVDRLKVICNIDGFSWETIAGYRIPYIMRVVNGRLLKFVATRMAEYQLLKKYLYNVHSYIYTSCTSIIAYRIIDPEVEILNHINETHYGYGKDLQFYAGIDYIVSLDDIHNFYLFLEVCYKKILCNTTSGYKDKCGYIKINFDLNCCLPYCTQDGQKYVPLFYIRGCTESLRQRAVKLEKWNLAYLKFCCRIQGIKDELFYGNSWLVVSLDDVKNLYPPETDFTDIWPSHLADVYLITNQKSFQSNPPDSWFRAVLEVVPDQNTIPDTSAASVPINPHSTLVTKNQIQQQQQQIMTTPQIQANSISNNTAYKIQMATIEDKIIYCINARPCIYSDWMVTLKDLVRMVLPSCNVAKCAHILLVFLKTTLLFGKSEQLALLMENGLIQSKNPGDTPMAMLQDVTQVLPQLKKFVLMKDDVLTQYKPKDSSFKAISARNLPNTGETD